MKCFLNYSLLLAVTISFLTVSPFVKGESTIVTVTADPPTSTNPSTVGTENAAEGSSPSSSGGDGEVTVESLNFRLRYVEEALKAYSRNIISLSKRIKQLEAMLGEDGQQSNTIVVSKPEAKRYNKISQYFPYSKFA